MELSLFSQVNEVISTALKGVGRSAGRLTIIAQGMCWEAALRNAMRSASCFDTTDSSIALSRFGVSAKQVLAARSTNGSAADTLNKEGIHEGRTNVSQFAVVVVVVVVHPNSLFLFRGSHGNLRSHRK